MPENRLANETSPYLLQHKDNPVDWYPWGPEALAKAKGENKPILLSVGYAACHWCHVMAHESFETESTARVMNELFVNIKVDREERPDIDTIYQSALALLGEHGGWPLTMFLTPEGEPFWGGTYFPPEPRLGRPGFIDVLRKIAELYAKQPERIASNVTALREALEKLSKPQASGAIGIDVIDQAAARLVREIDPFHGGIGSAPKFPNPAVLKLLWRAWKRTKADPYRHAVELTLTKMSQGGIYDHLGGGYARYAVDDRWLVPHFEKMLYDNAQVLDLLTWLWQETRNPLFGERARETVGWVLREMIADSDGSANTPTGAFASTLDADSEGEEGKYYVWTEQEIDAVLGADSKTFKDAYDVSATGNWEGKTILNRSKRPDLGDAAHEAKLAELRHKLWLAREDRVRPGWDDKVLADWNGLMIAALAMAAPVFDEPLWLSAAERAFEFVARQMTEHGRLRHSWRHGQLRNPATLDDYANMADAALALYEATGRSSYIAQAEAWVETLNRHYWDPDGGGYFLTADDAADLIVRTKTAYDSAVPSGNGTMVGVLARLYYLTGNDSYRERAEALVAAFSGELARNFFPLTTLLNGSELLSRALQIVVVGERGGEDTAGHLRAIHGTSLPNRIVQVVRPEEALPPSHPAAAKGQVGGKATAYVCHGNTCSLPMTEPAELSRALGAP